MKAKIFLTLAAVAALGGLTACNDDDVTVEALPMPVLAEPVVTHSAASFSWSEIPGATQYAYELIDPEGHQAGADVTRLTSVSFEGLAPATDYEFSVWAYAPVYTENGTSPRQTVKITTNALNVIEAPVLERTTDGAKTTFTWPFDPSASGYFYTIEQYDASEGGFAVLAARTTPADHVSFVCLPLGRYRLTVNAVSDLDGYATVGGEAREEFEVTETRELKQSDFTGAFIVHTTGLEYVNSSGDPFDFTAEVKISSIPGGLGFPNLFWSGTNVKGKFDPATRTFTFAAQKWGESYVFAGFDGITSPVVATLSADNNEITLDDWTGYYDNVFYFEQTHSTYTRN